MLTFSLNVVKENSRRNDLGSDWPFSLERCDFTFNFMWHTLFS